MLKSLRICNYAIIDDLSIEFDKGFNVFTGETGAGKSIIFAALALLIRGRSDSSLIQTGKEKAIIEGVFDIEDKDIKEILDNQDIPYDNELIIKRVISADNHNSIKINESNVTLNFLNDLLIRYVDIHSQKDNQLLYSKSYQLELLDKYANTKELLAEYKILFNNYLSVKKQYEELLNNNYNEREIEFLKYDLDELLQANINEAEEDELNDLEKRFKSFEKYSNIYNTVSDLYNKNSGIKEQLYDLINSINVDDDKLNEIKNVISNNYYSLEDNINNLLNLLNSYNIDYLNIDEVEERLYTYNKLKRKHKTDTKGLLELIDSFKLKIEAFEDKDRVLNEKEKAVKKAYDNAYKCALKLSEIRKKAAVSLEKEVLKETSDLLLNNCQFKIDFEVNELNINGVDDVEFLVSMNKGESLKNLRNVASGGEISRLMLALKAVFTKLSTIDLLILDEIDTGVSGNIAFAVGQKIAKIAKNCQVLCISHLSPVAACANNHYLIYKKDDSSKTNTNVKKLNYDEIIEELAAISNTNKNLKAIDAAKELYKSAQDIIKSLWK